MYTRAIRNNFLDSYACAKGLCASKYHTRLACLTRPVDFAAQGSSGSNTLTTTRSQSCVPTSLVLSTCKPSSMLMPRRPSMLRLEFR